MSTFLEWFTLYMVAFPEVQEKLYAEVCSVIGERSATLEDRSATHFAEATILEVMRHCPHLALTIPHYTSESTTIGGLYIPKDTQVYYNSGPSTTQRPSLRTTPSSGRKGSLTIRATFAPMSASSTLAVGSAGLYFLLAIAIRRFNNES